MSSTRPRPGPGLRLALLATLLLATAATGLAEDRPPVKVSAALAAASAAAGDTLDVRFHLEIPKGQHVYPRGSEDGLGVEARLEGDAAGIAPGALTTDTPTTTIQVEGVGPVVCLEGNVDFVWKLKLAPDLTAGSRELKLTFSHQACNDKKCFPQVETPFALPLEVKPRTGSGASDASVSSALPTTSVTGATPAAIAEPASARGLVLTSILAGITMLFLPCTYPMIPITISIFSKGKKLAPAQAWFRAAAYGGGIVISFTLVGGVVQAFLGAQGQNFVRSVATNGPLNIAIGALFVYFALSFFGYYEVGLPQFLNDLVNKGLKSARSSGGGGEGGVPTLALFAMGFFFCITSYTCGAPIVLAVITVGASVPGKATVIAATAIFGATIALPFMALALVPGALKSLPKGGNWFHTFKVALGTVELAAALKFISNADLYWRWGILTRPVFLGLWVVCALFLVGYLAGVIRLGHDEAPETPEGAIGPRKFDPRGSLAAIPFLAAAIYLASGLNPTRRLESNLDSFLPPDPYPGEKSDAGAGGHFPSYSSYDAALGVAKKSGRVLFVEFTGHTCVNCRKMEKTVLVAPRVREEISRLEPAVLFTDGHTPDEDANGNVQAERFGTAVIPAYFLVDKDGKLIARQEGSATEEEFLAFLAKARSGS